MSADIKLEFPIKVAGATVDAVRLRRPTVKDLIAADSIGGDNAARKELAVFASLSGLAPADLESLDLKDYRKLQEAYSSFLD